jgi:hypothetical protein
MSAPVAAAVISSAASVVVLVLAGIGGAWRLGANRRYERRIAHVADLQDRGAVLRAANRAYGSAVQQAVRDANVSVQAAGDAGGPADPRARNLVRPQTVPSSVDDAQADAQDRVRIAETRIEDTLIVDLGQHWQTMSRRNSLDESDVTAAEAEDAWDWFLSACSQALNSRRGKLRPSQRRQWRAKLDAVVDNSNSTDPDPPADGAPGGNGTCA